MRGQNSKGFTLIELLTVMAIITVILAVSTPAVNALKGSGDFSRSASQLADVLQQARTYALSHNTYVYVGLTEMDGTNPKNSGEGRVVLMLMASKDGTRGYDVSNPTPLSSTTLALLSKPVVLPNMHLALSTDLSAAGSMATLPQLNSQDGSLDLGAADSATPIDRVWNNSSYTFSKVVQFDPRGVARIHVSGGDGENVPLWIQISLQEAKGNTIPANAQEGAIQIAGVSGAVRVYRP